MSRQCCFCCACERMFDQNAASQIQTTEEKLLFQLVRLVDLLRTTSIERKSMSKWLSEHRQQSMQVKWKSSEIKLFIRQTTVVECCSAHRKLYHKRCSSWCKLGVSLERQSQITCLVLGGAKVMKLYRPDRIRKDIFSAVPSDKHTKKRRKTLAGLKWSEKSDKGTLWSVFSAESVCRCCRAWACVGCTQCAFSGQSCRKAVLFVRQKKKLNMIERAAWKTFLFCRTRNKKCPVDIQSQACEECRCWALIFDSWIKNIFSN